MKSVMSIRDAVELFAIPGIKSCPGSRFSNNDIVDMLRGDHKFNRLLTMYNRKDDVINLRSKRWVETWERSVRQVFIQSDENIKMMEQKHGIKFLRYQVGKKTVRYWVFVKTSK